MTKEEVELLFKRDEQINKARKEEKPVARKTTSSKVVNFSIDGTLYEQFVEKVNESGLSVPIVLRAAVLSYAFGGLELRGDRLKSKDVLYDTASPMSTQHVPRETFAPTQTTERKKPGPKPSLKPDYSDPMHDSAGKLLMPENWDHENIPVDKYPPAIVRPIRGVEDQACLLWTTKGNLSGETFEAMCDEQWIAERVKVTEREWESTKMLDYVARCANKFLLSNGMQALWYNPDVLQDGMYKLRDKWHDFVIEEFMLSGKEYK